MRHNFATKTSRIEKPQTTTTTTPATKTTTNYFMEYSFPLTTIVTSELSNNNNNIVSCFGSREETITFASQDYNYNNKHPLPRPPRRLDWLTRCCRRRRNNTLNKHLLAVVVVNCSSFKFSHEKKVNRRRFESPLLPSFFSQFIIRGDSNNSYKHTNNKFLYTKSIRFKYKQTNK